MKFVEATDDIQEDSAALAKKVRYYKYTEHTFVRIRAVSLRLVQQRLFIRLDEVGDVCRA